MHPNPTFRAVSEAENLRWAATRGAGVLAVSDPEGPPLMAQFPFVIRGDQVLFHLVRSNPVARAIRSGLPGKLYVSGPESYVSPDWYGIDDQVPTWNYVSVHLAGPVTQLPQDRLGEVLELLSDRFESELAPKPIWKMTKVPAEALDRMMRQIVPCALRIETVEGTWKLGQNKPDAARLSAADGVERHGIGQEVAALADLMRAPPAQD